MLFTPAVLAAEALFRRPFLGIVTRFNVPPDDCDSQNLVATGLVFEAQMDLKGLLGCIVQLPPATSRQQLSALQLRRKL